MIVKMLGHVHREGTSKSSGKKYAFDVLYVSYPDPYVTGVKCQELAVDPSVLVDVVIAPDTFYNIDVNLAGKVCAVTQSHLTPPASDRSERSGGVFSKGGAR